MADTDPRNSPPSSKGVPAPNPNMITAITNFEDSLRALREMYSDQQFQQAKLDQRGEDLTVRENELAGREQRLKELEQRLEAQSRDIEGLRDEVKLARGELERQSGELEKRQREQKSAGSELDRARAEIEAKTAELDRAGQELRKRKAEQDQAAEQIARKMKDIEDSTRVSSEAADRRAAELQQMRAEVDAKQKELGILQQQVASRESQFKSRDEELARERSRLENERAKLGEREQELGERAKQYELDKGEIETLRARVAELEELAEERRQQVERAVARAGEIGAELGKTLIKSAELEAQVASSKKGKGENPFEAQRKAEFEQMRSRLGALALVVEEYEQLWGLERGEVAQLTRALQQRAEDVAELEAVLAQLRDRMKDALSAREGPAGDTSALQAQYESRLLEQGERLRQTELAAIELKEKLTQEFELRQKAEQAHAASEQERVALQRKFDKIYAKLQDTQADLQRAMSDKPSFGPTESSARLERRRERLRMFRRLVRDKSDRLRKGGEVLKKRFEACEQLLGQRAELAQVHTTLMQGQKRFQREQATRKAGMAMACIAGAFAIVAGLSWVASREFFPGRYAVITELRAEGRGRTLNSAELKEWQRYHDELVVDPRFAETVAKRMARKAMAELGTPGAVQTRLAADFTADSPQDGVIRLELRGDGISRTTRELETIATALASEANGARTERVDGGVTTPPSPVETRGPLDQTQLYAAAGMMGGGSAILGLIGLTIWRKLAKAKSKFEQEEKIAATLDETRWEDPQKMAA